MKSWQPKKVEERQQEIWQIHLQNRNLISLSFVFLADSWCCWVGDRQKNVLWSYSGPRWDLSKMKSHKLKSTTDCYESSQYLLWLFSQLLLELHSMIFQPLDSNESVSTAEEKNRNHRLRDSSELGLNIGTGPDVNPNVTFDPWLFNEDVSPTVTYMSLHVICQRCAGWTGDNRGLTLGHNVFKLILSLSLRRRKKISLRSRYFILENRRPHTHWAPSGLLSFTFVPKRFLQILFRVIRQLGRSQRKQETFTWVIIGVFACLSGERPVLTSDQDQRADDERISQPLPGNGVPCVDKHGFLVAHLCWSRHCHAVMPSHLPVASSLCWVTYFPLTAAICNKTQQRLWRVVTTTKYCRQLGGKGEGVVKVTRLGWLRWGSKFFFF